MLQVSDVLSQARDLGITVPELGGNKVGDCVAQDDAGPRLAIAEVGTEPSSRCTAPLRGVVMEAA
jgi:hypothetical protein